MPSLMESTRGNRTRRINDLNHKEKELSESEIQDRLQDLDDVLVIFNDAKKKLSDAVSLLRESINLYQDFSKKCNRSDSNRQVMVSKRLRIKFILDTLIVASGKLLSVMNSSSKIQAVVINDLKRDVVDPELLR